MPAPESSSSSLFWYRCFAALLLLGSLYCSFIRSAYIIHDILSILKLSPGSLSADDVAVGLAIANRWDIQGLGLGLGLAGIALLFWKSRIQFSLLTLLGIFLIFNALFLAGPVAAYWAHANFSEMLKYRERSIPLDPWIQAYYRWFEYGSYSLAAGVALLLGNRLARKSGLLRPPLPQPSNPPQ